MTVVTDLKANPEPLKLFNSLKILISNPISSDNALQLRNLRCVDQLNSRPLVAIRHCLSSWACWRSRCPIEQEKMMRIEEEEIKPTWLHHHLNHLPMLPMLLQMQLAKEEGRAKGKSKYGGKGEKRTVCQEYLTDKGCPKGDQCPHVHPRKTGKCLRCGATGHDVASCRRPVRDTKTKGSPSPPKGQGRGKGKAKAKPKPKAKAQAHEGTAQPAGANAAWVRLDLEISHPSLSLLFLHHLLAHLACCINSGQFYGRSP